MTCSGVTWLPLTVQQACKSGRRVRAGAGAGDERLGPTRGSAGHGTGQHTSKAVQGRLRERAPCEEPLHGEHLQDDAEHGNGRRLRWGASRGPSTTAPRVSVPSLRVRACSSGPAAHLAVVDGVGDPHADQHRPERAQRNAGKLHDRARPVDVRHGLPPRRLRLCARRLSRVLRLRSTPLHRRAAPQRLELTTRRTRRRRRRRMRGRRRGRRKGENGRKRRGARVSPPGQQTRLRRRRCCLGKPREIRAQTQIPAAHSTRRNVAQLVVQFPRASDARSAARVVSEPSPSRVPRNHAMLDGVTAKALFPKCGVIGNAYVFHSAAFWKKGLPKAVIVYVIFSVVGDVVQGQRGRAARLNGASVRAGDTAIRRSVTGSLDFVVFRSEIEQKAEEDAGTARAGDVGIAAELPQGGRGREDGRGRESGRLAGAVAAARSVAPAGEAAARRAVQQRRTWRTGRGGGRGAGGAERDDGTRSTAAGVGALRGRAELAADRAAGT